MGTPQELKNAVLYGALSMPGPSNAKWSDILRGVRGAHSPCQIGRLSGSLTDNA
jgi:hypothetical protein